MQNTKRSGNQATRFQTQFVLLMAGLLLAPVASASSGTPMNVRALRSLAHRAGWTVKESWVSRLSKDQIHRILGSVDTPDSEAVFAVPAKKKALGEKAEGLDWRNKDGVNWVSPILNQGNCGSCVAFASVATLETQMNITSGIPGFNPRFSPQALFSCGGGACEFGWQPGLAANYLMMQGVPDEACAPYTMGATGETVSCSSICQDAASRSVRIASYDEPSRGEQDIDAVKKALQHGPLMTTLMVYDDFLYYGGGIYKHVSGTIEGGHAVSIVGYDDNTRSWIIRNSWGTDWGENGFARVSWDDVSGISNSTWAFNLGSSEGYVVIRSPLNRDFVSATTTLKAESTYPQTKKTEFSILDHSGARVRSTACKGAACDFTLNTNSLADGKYEAVATATWQGGTASSEHHLFYVINHKPSTLSLSFSGSDGVDLTAPLSGRVVFDITADSGAVPFSSLMFHVKQGAKEVFTKGADIVVPRMTLGWRTGGVPNGQYEVWFTAKISTKSTDPSRSVEFDAESPHMTVNVAN